MVAKKGQGEVIARRLHPACFDAAALTKCTCRGGDLLAHRFGGNQRKEQAMQRPGRLLQPWQASLRLVDIDHGWNLR
jgi:hypothetical protein